MLEVASKRDLNRVDQLVGDFIDWYCAEIVNPKSVVISQSEGFRLSNFIEDITLAFDYAYRMKSMGMNNCFYNISKRQINDYAILEDSQLSEDIVIREQQLKVRDGVFSSIMLRLMSRGGVENGPLMALEFAKIYSKMHNSSYIPIKYGLSASNHQAKELIEEYIKMGGDMSVVSYMNFMTQDYGFECYPMVVEDVYRVLNIIERARKRL